MTAATTSGRCTAAWPAWGQRTTANKAAATTRSSESTTLPDGTRDAAGCSSAPCRAHYCAQLGDSGSPVYAFHHAYGIHQGADEDVSCTTYFQSIVNAQNGMNVDVILAP
jgi:hypothetical protein